MAEKEFIERKAAKNLACEICQECDGEVDVCEFRDIKVDSIPAADVRPVVRGKWVYNPGDNIPYCSECMMPQDSECNYCPNCWADMREES